jgi:hypothetical protein
MITRTYAIAVRVYEAEVAIRERVYVSKGERCGEALSYTPTDFSDKTSPLHLWEGAPKMVPSSLRFFPIQKSIACE